LTSTTSRWLLKAIMRANESAGMALGVPALRQPRVGGGSAASPASASSPTSCGCSSVRPARPVVLRNELVAGRRGRLFDADAQAKGALVPFTFLPFEGAAETAPGRPGRAALLAEFRSSGRRR
jgi:hypothetical protein